MYGCVAGGRKSGVTEWTGSRVPPAEPSVRYDADTDAFFISNLDDNRSQKNGNAFIARVHAANPTAMTMLVEGGKNGATLHAPKGMAIEGDSVLRQPNEIAWTGASWSPAGPTPPCTSWRADQ